MEEQEFTEKQKKPRRGRPPKVATSEESDKLERPVNPLALFADAAMSIEGPRIAAEVRLKHLSRQKRTDSDTEELLRRIRDLERFVDNRLKEFVGEGPSAHWWSQIPGCHLEIMGKILGHIENFGRFYPLGDPMIPAYVKREPVSDREGKQWVWVKGIERLATPSKLWKYAGLDPEMKRRKGTKIGFNMELKTILFRLMLFGFMAKKNKYYELYLRYKQWKRSKLEAEGIKIIPTPRGRYCHTCEKEMGVPKTTRYCPTCGNKLGSKVEPPGVIYEGHLDMMARRRVIKIFLAHLWAIEREALGLPLQTPYPVEFPVDGVVHSSIISPWDMVEKEKRAEG